MPDAAPPRPIEDVSHSPSSWLQNPWSRVIVGLILAQGLYYGLRQLCTAILKATGEEGQGPWWEVFTNIVVLQGLQVIGVLVGSILAGVGQRWGSLYGAGVGLGSGLLVVGVQYATGRVPTAVEFYGQPILLAAFGVLGGFIGGQIWKPLPLLTTPTPATPPALPLLKSRRRPTPLDGPVAWERVLVGIVVAVAGTLGANFIRDFVVDATGGALEIQTRVQAEFFTWEISMLAMIVGSAWAGANTRNGIKQGSVVGLGSGIILFGIYLYLGGRKPPEVSLGFALAGIHLRGLQVHLQQFIFTLTSVVALGLVGGWFGGQLLPPIVRQPRRDLGPLS